MKYLIANWKAQMTLTEMSEWTDAFIRRLKDDHEVVSSLSKNLWKMIIAPPAPFLPLLKDRFVDYPFIAYASQDVSSYKEGKYTGEITAKALKDFVSYAIIGHSERRMYFQESEEEIEQKISLCDQYGITPIVCVRSEKDIVYPSLSLVAYEPVEAIGTGHNADPATVIRSKKRWGMEDSITFIYGGSVDESNMQSYLEGDQVRGFLVGTSSLNPHTWYLMCKELSTK